MTIQSQDPKIAKIIKAEEDYQKNSINLIASDNYASLAVREALASVLQNRYSEGYPGAKYYGGQKYLEEIEEVAKSRALKMFRLSDYSWHVNVQPYSGSPANMAIYSALLKFGDKIMAMKLSEGGHLTHGHGVNFSGKAYNFSHYYVDKKTGMLDYDEIEKQALKEKPKMIVCGYTAYSRIIDFKRFFQISKKVNAILLADISHIAGLIVTRVHPSCFPHADIMMTTTHKTLRGPRGAIIISKKKYAKEIDRAVFPGLQGGPHENQIAAKAVCFGEALDPDFKIYAKQIVKNSKTMAKELYKLGFNIVSGGTDNHLMLIDLRNLNMTGKEAQDMLEEVGIICNKNTIPGDPQKPTIGSGIRIGTPPITTRGMKEKEAKIIAKIISQTLKKEIPKNKIQKEVLKLTKKFPIK